MILLAVFGAYVAVGLVLAIALLGAANFGGEQVVGPRAVVIITLCWPLAVFVCVVAGLVVVFEENGK